MDDTTVPPSGGPPSGCDPRTGSPEGSSLDLLKRVRAGDRAALEALLERYRPRIRRWASGRLPAWARDRVDTDDMVQDALIRTCDRIEDFEHRGEGAFQAYLLQALRNRIADEIRRVRRHAPPLSLANEPTGTEASPLEEAVGREVLESYERALEQLSDAEREAVIARVEMGMGYEELAAATGKASPDAARMSVSRALLRLAEAMGRARA